MRIGGVVLAGGQSRRMGGPEKSLLKLGTASILQWVLNRLEPQVETLAINANGDPERFVFADVDVIADEISGFAGPLAGVHSGMAWAKAKGLTHVITAAADTPFLPTDITERLSSVVGGDDTIAMCSSNGRIHPVCALWPVAHCGDLKRFLVEEDKRKILEFANRYELQQIDFDTAEFDPFFNINTPDDLDVARKMVSEHGIG